jgi:mRNA interferase RelE/StbE
VKYDLFIPPRAQKQLAKLDPSHLAAIKTKISALEDIPRPAGCKKLHGREGWRIRIGDYVSSTRSTIQTKSQL